MIRSYEQEMMDKNMDLDQMKNQLREAQIQFNYISTENLQLRRQNDPKKHTPEHKFAKSVVEMV